MPKKKSKGNTLDYPLIIITIVLVALGLIMILSASAPSSLAEVGHSYRYFTNQFLFAGFGFGALFVFSVIDYRKYEKFYWLIYIIGIFSIFIVMIPGVGVTVKGATRWAQIGPIGFQPSEITKIAMILFFAGYLTRYKDKTKSFFWGFLLPGVLIAIPVALLYKIQNHLSAGIILGSVSLIIILMGSVRKFYWIATGGLGGFTIFTYVISKMSNVSESFRLRRINTFLNPWSDPLGDGYQIIHSLYAFGSGGIKGRGLGNSIQKYSYIPEPENDFIFAILAEEFGFIGCIVVVAVFAAFIWRGIRISLDAKDMYGSLLAIGIVSLIAVQLILNIAVVTNSVPTTGVSLPFFSYGGTSLVLTLICVGVLLNISKNRELKEVK